MAWVQYLNPLEEPSVQVTRETWDPLWNVRSRERRDRERVQLLPTNIFCKHYIITTLLASQHIGTDAHVKAYEQATADEEMGWLGCSCHLDFREWTGLVTLPDRFCGQAWCTLACRSCGMLPRDFDLTHFSFLWYMKTTLSSWYSLHAHCKCWSMSI